MRFPDFLRIPVLALFTSMSFSSWAATAAEFPAKGTLRYELISVQHGMVVGQIVHDWSNDGRRYEARSVTETTGIAALLKKVRVVQSSQGLVGKSGLQPVEFRHEKVKGTDTASFDWERRLVRYEGREEALPAGTQDMLSLYYQASLWARPGKVFELPIATGRKLESYRFEPKGEEQLRVDGKAWRTARYAAKSGNDVIEVWIATDYSLLPLKIRFVDRKGEIFDQVAVAIDIKETQ